MKTLSTWMLLAALAMFSPAHAGFPSGGVYKSSSPLTPCTSTGVLDFSNTCNDIYGMVGLQ